jgi:glycosyltransferase involved in cell wall biosynthesis
VFTGFISDEKLMECLSTAALLVQPSLYEGFGFPPLEAMALGTGALVSDIPVFREIYGGFPVTFFRAGDSMDLKNKMMELLFNKKPASLVLPKELLLRYTFEKTAQTVLRELE